MAERYRPIPSDDGGTVYLPDPQGDYVARYENRFNDEVFEYVLTLTGYDYSPLAPPNRHEITGGVLDPLGQNTAYIRDIVTGERFAAFGGGDGIDGGQWRYSLWTVQPDGLPVRIGATILTGNRPVVGQADFRPVGGEIYYLTAPDAGVSSRAPIHDPEGFTERIGEGVEFVAGALTLYGAGTFLDSVFTQGFTGAIQAKVDSFTNVFTPTSPLVDAPIDPLYDVVAEIPTDFAPIDNAPVLVSDMPVAVEFAPPVESASMDDWFFQDTISPEWGIDLPVSDYVDPLYDAVAQIPAPEYGNVVDFQPLDAGSPWPSSWSDYITQAPVASGIATAAGGGGSLTDKIIDKVVASAPGIITRIISGQATNLPVPQGTRAVSVGGASVLVGPNGLPINAGGQTVGRNSAGQTVVRLPSGQTVTMGADGKPPGGVSPTLLAVAAIGTSLFLALR